MNVLALLDATVGRAVDLEVVVGRVGGAVRQLLGDESEELVLDLVGDGVPHERQVGLVLVEHVLDQRVVRRLPVETLLDVGLLADDAGLEDREVAGLRRRELLGDEVLERAGEAGLTLPVRPRGDGTCHRRVEQPHLGEVALQPLDLDEHRPGLAVERVGREVRAAVDRDLDVGPLAFPQVGHLVVAVLGEREQHPVVLAVPVAPAVVDVGVQAVLVAAGAVDHPQAHLHRRAVGLRHIGPAGRRQGRGLRERSLTGEPGGMVELQTEGGGERRRVERG